MVALTSWLEHCPGKADVLQYDTFDFLSCSLRWTFSFESCKFSLNDYKKNNNNFLFKNNYFIIIKLLSCLTISCYAYFFLHINFLYFVYVLKVTSKIFISNDFINKYVIFSLV